ncbi:MAG TPA: cardiolipin synthase [Anaeromyxobacteraceae bacterium]|nr:cardiolipin synthase [Anaeromyxobacteraceae bacterium]
MRYAIFHPPVAIVVLLAIVDLWALYRAITRGHGVEGTIAWVFAILAFPGVGALAYFGLANPRVRPVWKRRRRAALLRMARRLTGGPRCLAPEGSVLRLASGLSGLLPSTGNRVELLAEDDSAFRRLADAVAGATRSVWVEYYLIQNDATGKAFLDLLAERARARIDVRLLYDAIGSMRLDKERLEKIRRAGGHAEPFLTLNPFRRRWAVHLRNHRKLVVIDGERGFTGGMNVGDEYSGRARRRGLAHFRDSHLAIEGPAVGDLSSIFAEDWHLATGQRVAPRVSPVPVAGGDARVAVIPSGPDQDYNATGMVYFASIGSARRRCWITTPYFVPDGATVRALQSSALRGVDLRVLLPARQDVWVVGPAARSFYPALLRSGVRIFEYQPSMLHAKTLVVDGALSLVGSGNVDFRSFRLNFELGALLESQDFARLLESRFEEDLRLSREVREADLAHRPVQVRIEQGVARLLAPLL